MTPPPRFDSVRFDTYIPNREEPSQAEVVQAPGVHRGSGRTAAARGCSLFGRKKTADDHAGPPDGGFGVGKTHLLASMARRRAQVYGTFVELTNLVGALVR